MVGTSTWKLAVLGGLLGVAGAMGYGMALPAEGFWTSGERYADWYWLNPQCGAQWDFLSLPTGGDSHIAVEAFLCLSLPNGSAPAEIEVRFQIGTAAERGRLWVARLQRIQWEGGHALYFGQLFLSRREIGLGSRLTVRLDGSQAGIPLGIHPTSVRISVGPGGGLSPVLAAATPNGQGGGQDEVVAAGMATEVSPTRTLPDSNAAESAPFLAPGTYRGSLGWAGPYATLNGKGVYRVNLRAGEIITVHIETGSPCALSLLDPSGRKVGEIEGSSWLGLEYRAHATGAWQIVLSCREAGSRFPYTLSLEIR
ncbi:conserved protein of unknown function [Candidatus Bipolaricaulis anaerobius]|jgi:hypothetical protein|uniref:Uncharacterized protein n=1 Tax=Candidatus Bipolaricaulis anaerobius TaxID=2026885 RepID=A0A2X3KKJ6_9BACT|nr:hypothetical protein [Candidatus Bipolaricaulis anaerobius]SQD92922.1 conserved protein of unknown function [Candidatus Bipolaricaulis anaerobius]